LATWWQPTWPTGLYWAYPLVEHQPVDLRHSADSGVQQDWTYNAIKPPKTIIVAADYVGSVACDTSHEHYVPLVRRVTSQVWASKSRKRNEQLLLPEDFNKQNNWYYSCLQNLEHVNSAVNLWSENWKNQTNSLSWSLALHLRPNCDVEGTKGWSNMSKSRQICLLIIKYINVSTQTIFSLSSQPPPASLTLTQTLSRMLHL
jgi:hypothetical protein